MCRRGNADGAAQAFAALPRSFAIIGQAAVTATRARLADPAFASGVTLRAHLEAMQAVVGVVREAVAPSSAWDSDATLLLHRCAVSALELCEPLVSRCGRGALEVAPCLLFVIAATDSTPAFAEASFLGLRVRLYGLACRAYDAAGTSALAYAGSAVPPTEPSELSAALAACVSGPAAVESATAGGWPFAEHVAAARELCMRGLRAVAACQRMHLLDAPVLDSTCAAVDTARAELLVRKFRYDSFVSAPAALAALQVGGRAAAAGRSGAVEGRQAAASPPSSPGLGAARCCGRPHAAHLRDPRGARVGGRIARRSPRRPPRDSWGSPPRSPRQLVPCNPRGARKRRARARRDAPALPPGTAAPGADACAPRVPPGCAR